MEVRPGYKQTEVGVIPEDWRSTCLGDEADIVTGFPFPSSGFTKSGIRLLRGSNVKRGVVDWSIDITQHWPVLEVKTRAFELKKDDLVIAMDGALVGRSFAIIAVTDLPALLVQRVARLRSKKSVQDLLYAWVASDFFVRHVDLVKTHTAIPHISPKDIRDFALVVPSARDEQLAIATALSDVDSLLGAQDRLIAKKRDLKQAAMQQLLTGQTRLPGFSGEWKVKTLGDLGVVSGGGVDKKIHPEEPPVRLVNYMDVYRRTFIRAADLDHIVSASPEQASRCAVRMGDIFFTPSSEMPYDIASSAVDRKSVV